MRAALLSMVVLALLTSCKKAADKEEATPGTIQVCVSIPPLLGVFRAIGGDAVQVTSLMSDQDDPHTFSPTPQTVAKLRDTDLFVTIGVDYEKVLASKVSRMFPELVLVDASRSLHRLGHDGHAEHAEHDAHGCEHASDPHVWLSIPNLITIADNARAALSKASPEHAKTFAKNYSEYEKALRARHTEFADRLKSLKGRSFCVYHPVFGYFARDYDLHQATVEIDGKAPSPRQLRDLYKKATKEGFRVVFVQPQFNEGPAKTIAERIGGRVVRVNPLAENPVAVLGKGVSALVEGR